MKKYLLLILCLVSSLIASAESGTCGDNLTWELEDGVLTISGTGAMDNYVSYLDSWRAPWYSCRSSISRAVISEGVTSVGEYAFDECSGLTSITIPNSVTSIGSDAFEGCSGLTSVIIPRSVTSIGEYAFANCVGLTSVNITDLASWCNIDFGNEYANPLCYAHKLVLNGTEIKDLVIPEDVTKIKNCAFAGCIGLTSITIPNFVTSIGDYAFYGCSGLTSITIPDGVTSIGSSAFSRCGGLTSITIPNSVTSIGDYAFGSCFNLTSIVIPNSVTSIGNDTFRDCRGLTSVNVSCKDIDDFCGYLQRTDISSVFYASELKSKAHNIYIAGELQQEITIPNSVSRIEGSAFEYYSNLTSITIPNSVTSIGDYAFGSCFNLTSITIPNSVTSIGNYTFRDCRGLTSVNVSCKDIDDFCGYLQRTDISSVFYASELMRKAHNIYIAGELQQEITIPNSVTRIEGSAFEYYSNLTSITIPNFVTSIGKYAFSNCNALTSITIPNSVVFMGEGVFASCNGLTSIAIPDGVRQISDHAFFGCSSLTSITIGNSVTSLGGYAFHGCSSLTSINIPKSMIRIGNSAFWGCRSLTSIIIPNSVTRIGADAFYGCYMSKDNFENNSACSDWENWGLTLCDEEMKEGLLICGQEAIYCRQWATSIIIPSSVTCIRSNAFKDCNGLSSVEISDIAAWCNISFGEDFSNPTSYTHKLILNGTEIKNLVIPEGVTEIKKSTFEYCSNLLSLSIPNSVVSIGDAAFYGADKLTKIYSLAVIPPTCGAKAFNENIYPTANVYVPKTNNALTRYLGSDVWKNFYNLQVNDLSSVDAPTITPLPADCKNYDLQGLHTTGVSRGLYIVNGHKVLR